MTPDEQLHAAILTACSPSNIGDYAGCPMKLVLDAQTPKVDKPFLAPYSSFGTVAHWLTQSILIQRGIAVATNLKAPDARTLALARECKGVPGAYESQFIKWMEMVATKAADILQVISPLAPGTHWIAEKGSYNASIMPTRLGRKGNLSGFGGSIDVLRSDRDVLWDFKFVGTDKVPTPPTSRSTKVDAGITNQYLWQLAGYHLSEGVPRTGLLWTSRDAESVSYLLVDWTDPRAAALAASVRGFLNFVSYKDFHKMAWPVRGPVCQYCDHAGPYGKCPAYCVIGAQDPSSMQARAGLASLMDLDSVADIGAQTGTQSLFS